MKRAARIVPLVLLLAGAGSPARAVTAETVRIALGGFGNAHYLPYDVADALGYFAEEGLDVEFEYVKSGTQAASALLAGGVDFSGNSLGHALKTHLLLMRREYRGRVRGLADLRGRPIGVTGLGSGSHMVLSYVLTRAGLEPGEINAVAVGADTGVAALENGLVDGIMASAVAAASLRARDRAFVFLDLTARGSSERLFGGPYIETGVLTRSDVIARRSDVCRRLVRAVVRANRWIAAHTPREIAGVLPEGVVGDRRVYEAALALLHDGFSRDGRIEPRAVETVVDAHRALGWLPAGRRVDPTSLYDDRFVEQVLSEKR